MCSNKKEIKPPAFNVCSHTWIQPSQFYLNAVPLEPVNEALLTCGVTRSPIFAVEKEEGKKDE